MPFTSSFPFRRLFVDHMIDGVTRVWWQLESGFNGAGPLTFQLQAGYAGLSEATDWVDVGTPVEDAWYADDDQVRLRGKVLLNHYRVKLSAATATYMSNPVGVYGIMPEEDWLLAREIVRKEILRSKKVGREGILLKRIRYGAKCTRCRDPLTKEVTDSRCPECFSADTLVRTQTGFKRIADICEGEFVLSADGVFHRVTETMKRRYAGKAYRIRTVTMTRAVTVTPEHPFRALASTHTFIDTEQLANRGVVVCGPSPCDQAMQNNRDALYRPTGASFHTKTGKWRAKAVPVRGGAGAITLGYFRTKDEAQQAVFTYREKHFDLLHRLDWVAAKDLAKYHWIDTTYPRAEQDIARIAAPVRPAKNRQSVEPRQGATIFDVDEDFLWVIGLYIAEGSTGKRSISFALHRDEGDYRDRLLRFFTAHGFHPAVSYPKGSKGMNIAVYSTTLAEWFPGWLGRYCDEKRIPEEFMQLPAHKTQAIIQGIWDGDGTKDTNEIRQTSELLTMQLCELLHRIGRQPTIHQNKDRPGKKPDWTISWEEPTLGHKNRKGRWCFDNRVLSQIAEYAEIDYDDYVYNLEVEDNHTYVVQSNVVHNCRGTGFKVGYHPPTRMQCWDLSPETIEEKRNGTTPVGQSRDTQITARVLGFPDLSLEDVWVDGHSDQRWYVDVVKHTALMRGVPLIMDVTMNLAPYTDTIYRVPVGQESNADPRDGMPTSGAGSVLVDHNYLGVDSLAYQKNGDPDCGIEGAYIYAFTKADYLAGLRRPQDAKAATTTSANGWWTYAMKLDPGDYILLYEKPGEYGPDIQALAVTNPNPPLPPPPPQSSSSIAIFGPV